MESVAYKHIQEFAQGQGTVHVQETSPEHKDALASVVQKVALFAKHDGKAFLEASVVPAGGE